MRGEDATAQHSDAPPAQPAPNDPEPDEATPLRPPAPLIPRAAASEDDAAEHEPPASAPYADLVAASEDTEPEPEPAAQPDAGQRRRHLIVASLAAGVGAAAIVSSVAAGDVVSITSFAGVLFLAVAGARYSLARNA
ncbi:MAG: hypothetical protein F4X76_10920 [Chloroflexi bacterium]|nr:hypothetical protein [Chloroflexota bacterium]